MPLQFYARARFQSEIWGKDASKQTLGPRRESEHATRATKAGREKGEREKERERQARRQEGKGPGVADARARLCGSECAGYITGRMPSFFSLALIVVATTRSNSTKKGLCWSRSRRSLLFDGAECVSRYARIPFVMCSSRAPISIEIDHPRGIEINDPRDQERGNFLGRLYLVSRMLLTYDRAFPFVYPSSSASTCCNCASS